MENHENCPICNIHNSIDRIPKSIGGIQPTKPTVILECNENWVLRIAPETKNCPGYLYLEPRSHVTSWAELGEDLTSLGVWMKKGLDFIQNQYNPRKIYTITISEAVPHIHIHLIPHYGDTKKGIDYIREKLEA